MTDERAIRRIEELLVEVTRLGGQNERTSIVSNLTVVDAAPSGLTNFITIADERDGDTILAKTVPGIIYAVSDKVNVLFVEGAEPIAFQQGSESPSGGLWEIVPSTSTDIFYDRGDVGIGKSVAPDASLEILDTAQAQLRLTHTEDTKFADFTLDTNHDLTIKPSSTGQVIFQSTTDSVDFLQVLDADGGVPVWNIDTVNERAGVGTATPQSLLDVNGDMLLSGGSQDYLFTDRSAFLELQSQTAATTFALELFSNDGDGTDDVNLNLFAVGLPSSVTNRERLQIKYEATGTQFEIFTEANGTGTLRPLVLYTEGNTDQLHLDTGGDVGIGVAAPDRVLHVRHSTLATVRIQEQDDSFFDVRDNSGTQASINKVSNSGAAILDINPQPLDGTSQANFRFFRSTNTSGVVNFQVFRGDNTATFDAQISAGDEDTYFSLPAAANTGIGTNAPAAKLDIDQSSTTGAKPVALFDQADVSEEMFEFVSTIGVGNAIEAVGAKTLTVTHFIKVTLPGSLTRYIEVGTIA